MTSRTGPLPGASRAMCQTVVEPFRRAVVGPSRRVLDALRRVAFWGAVLVPLAYLPLLAGPVDDRRLLLVGALLAINGCCLLLGHDHAT